MTETIYLCEKHGWKYNERCPSCSYEKRQIGIYKTVLGLTSQYASDLGVSDIVMNLSDDALQECEDFLLRTPDKEILSYLSEIAHETHATIRFFNAR